MLTTSSSRFINYLFNEIKKDLLSWFRFNSFTMKMLIVALLLLAGVSADIQIEDQMKGVKEMKSIDEVTSGKWFVLYYSPGCGFCKRIAAEWKRLGEAHPTGVTIAKLNTETHSKPDYVSGFPTIILYQYDDNNELQWQEYENHANRDRDHFTEFITNSVSGTSTDTKKTTFQQSNNPVVWYYVWNSELEEASEALVTEQVEELILKGEISSTTLMAKAGDTEWAEANTFDFVSKLLPQTPITELSDSTFSSKTTDGRHWLVAVVVPECGFCKRLAPEWEALAEYYSDSTEVGIGRVNAELSPETASSLGASGFPTIFGITPQGRKVEFSDHPNRNRERFISFIDEMQQQDDDDEEL